MWTVKRCERHVDQEDFSESFPEAASRRSKLDGFKPIIQGWLADDARVRYKQRHTAERVYQRLKKEYGATFACSYSTVQRFIKKGRAARPAQQTGALELEWAPGTAQVDFGTADAYWTPRDTQ